ncbi:MAG TPA: phosphate ABC transporter substrate-binding protein [Methanosarcina sp.]|jgi:phosphate transport system substrate-binding protein
MTNKLKTYAILTLLIIGFVFLAGCAGKNSESSSPAPNTSSEGTPVQGANAGEAQNASAGEAQSISVKGSDTILPLAQAEAEAFMNQSSGKSISVTGGGSGVGIAALIDGQVDIADASREMNDNETQNAKQNGINPVKTTIAYDGITVVVNPSNPVSNLTFTQLRGIYNGSISNWKEVGGTDAPIAVISRDSSSGTYKDFQELAMNKDNYRPDALTQSATGGIVSEVSQNPNAIGYIGFAYLDNSTKALSLDKGNGSVAPTPESILDGSYPLSRSLYMYTNGEPSGLAKEFINFILSDQGQKVVSTVGYIPLKK